MKKTIIMLLVLLMTLTGCQKEEEPQGQFDKYDYSDYGITDREKPEPFVCPDIRDYMTDGKLGDTEPYSIALAAYVMRNEDLEENRKLNRKLESFYLTMMKTLLDGRENSVFSPLNLYFNLTALSCIAHGQARDEILNLLGVDSDNAVTEAKRLWTDNNVTGKATIKYANSMWFSDTLNVKKDILQTMAEDCYCDSFRGQMGTEEYTGAFQKWLNDNTGGLLDEYISQLELTADVKMALASTIYYKGSWEESYETENTRKETFHGLNGDSEVSMMHKSGIMLYFDNDYFTGVVDHLGTGLEAMVMLMPKEGVSWQQMFDSEEFRNAVLQNPNYNDDSFYPNVDLGLPRFDVSASYQLEDILPELGITGIFGGQGDAFAPVTDEPLRVDTVQHACRLKTDEEGVEAAAYTVEMQKYGMSMNIVEMTFDHPFFFALKTDYDNSIFFAGIVTQP
ncbi:MAG: hypothetical protein IJG49_06375 [Erysipelotrichaceae bacterium]|nr:hypothetical protein [Erysipelotrichaceae bacterium]